MFNRTSNFIKSKIQQVKSAFTATRIVATAKAHEVLDGTRAEAYVDTGVKILIAVVIGALLLTLLYALFDGTIMPKVTEKVNGIFNYSGGAVA